MAPETRYARSGELHIAYQVVGEGSMDLVFVPSWISQVEHYWEEPTVARYFNRLASFSRLIMFDRRGSGLSDPVLRAPTLEEQMDDVVAVMDTAGSERATVFAQLEGGAMAALFAATHPERTEALVLYEAMPRMSWAPDYDWPPRPEEREAMLRDGGLATWGDGSRLLGLAPQSAENYRLRRWFAKLERLAEHIPGARYVELPGSEAFSFGPETRQLLDEVEEFLTGARHVAESERILATVMFSDIVDSTRRAAELGDRDWRQLLEALEGLVGTELDRFRGRARHRPPPRGRRGPALLSD